MSGHSKWASIKHKKAITDAKRSKVFSKYASLISIAAKNGGDPGTNPNLRLMIEKGKSVGMTKDNIERAVKRGTGELGGAALEEVTYEAYGPGGIGIIIEAVTDNRNRIVSEIRALLNKYNGKLAATGAVAYQFSKKGMIVIPKQNLPSDEIELLAIDAGAEDIHEGDPMIIYTAPHDLEKVKNLLDESEIQIDSDEITFVPQQMLPVSESASTSVIKLLEALDELEDTTGISTNADL